MTADGPTAAAGSGDFAAVTASDAWLDAVSRSEPPPGDPLAAALADWLAELSADYTAIPVPRRVARRSVSGAAAFAAAVVLFAGAGTAAAVPGSPIHDVIFGHARTHHSPAPVNDGAARRALAQAAGIIEAAQHTGEITPAEHNEASRLLASAAGAIGQLPIGADRTSLDGQRIVLLDRLARLRLVEPATARRTPTPRPASTLSGAGGHPRQPTETSTVPAGSVTPRTSLTASTPGDTTEPAGGVSSDEQNSSAPAVTDSSTEGEAVAPSGSSGG